MSRPHPIPFQHVPTLSELTAGFPGVRALFFDMDGTLFDTERYHTRAFLKLGQDHQVVPPHSMDVIHQMLVGKADHLVFEVVRSWKGFPQHWTAKDFVDEKTKNLLAFLAEVPSSEYFPVSLSVLIGEAKKAGLHLALVTSSERVITDRLLKVAGLESAFDHVLTRDDCPRHKPDPWPYRKAMELTGVSPHEAVIFEDSGVGLEAAQASGAHVIKVEWHPEFIPSKA